MKNKNKFKTNKGNKYLKTLLFLSLGLGSVFFQIQTISQLLANKAYSASDSVKEELLNKLNSLEQETQTQAQNQELSRFQNLKDEDGLFNKSKDMVNSLSGKEELINIVKKDLKRFTKDHDWYIIGNTDKSISINEKPSVIFWQNYYCETCVKLFDVYKIYKHKVKFEESFKYVDIPISILPVVVKGQPLTYYNAAVFNNALSKGEDEFFKLNSQYLSQSLKNDFDLKDLKINISNEDFNSTYLIEKRFSKEKVKDLPMIRVGNFIITSETIRRMPSNQLVDLVKFISALAILHQNGFVSVEN